MSPALAARPRSCWTRFRRVVTLTVEQTPPGAAHWSRASMAERTGLSRSTIGRIWRRFDLKPHRADTFKISTDLPFVEKVVDVVGLYHHLARAGRGPVRGREVRG